MTRQQVQLYHVTIFALVFGSTYLVAHAQNGLPDGACYLKNEEKNDLMCSSGVEHTESNAAYVEEQTYCQHTFNGRCFTCIDGSLFELGCEESHVTREKRGWGRRILRRIARPVERLFRRSRPQPPPNTPPTITCPSIPNRITAPANSNTAVVTWSAPSVSDRENNIASTQLISGRASGTTFGEGSHSVVYKVTDTRGASSTCTVSFTIHVIRCPAPRAPSNGIMQCPSTIGHVFGATCTFSCNTGYELSGPATATCQNSAVFTALPTCQKIQCGNPPVPSNAKSVSCSDGNSYQSVCSPVCSQGYLPSRGARSVCSVNKKWTSTSWTCEDNESPVFTSCPTKKINTVDKNFRWNVTATDNTGKVTLKQVQGQAPGSPMDFGIHIIKYVASDAAGNSVSCVFSVELKEADCPRPSSGDSDMKFTCNGLTIQSVCHLSCGSGSFVQGGKYIACVRDETGNNTSVWQPIDGENAACYKKTCPALSPPKNGALACDKQLGGTVCQIQCDENYDVAPGEGTPATYICGENTEAWNPSNIVPDCLEMAYPDEYSLPTEFYYFVGDCTDTQALNRIKQQFIENLNTIGLSPCVSDTCSVEDIKVTCGDKEVPIDLSFRRKRSANSANGILHVHVTFRVQNFNKTLSPDAAASVLKSLADKSKDAMSNNTEMRGMLYKSLPKPTLSSITSYSKSATGKKPAGVSPPLPTVPPTVKALSVTGSLAMECTAGSVQLKSKPGVCVPCSVGTYADKKSHTCKPCPMNSYQNIAGATSCKCCPVHHTTLSTGAATRGACKALCGKDTFSSTGLVPCYPCPDGTHQPAYGRTTCIACPESHIVGQALPKCLNWKNKETNSTTMPPEFQVSNYLLTCETEVCLSF